MPSSNTAKRLTIKRLIITDSAKKDLTAIANYTKKKWGVQQQQYYLALIKKSFISLQCSEDEDFQRVIGSHRPDIDKNLFSYFINKHTVYYRKNAQAFIIIRVLHNSMEPSKHLK